VVPILAAIMIELEILEPSHREPSDLKKASDPKPLDHGGF
jgi:hypothetical protein